MALRTTTLAADKTSRRSYGDWRVRVESHLAAAGAAVRGVQPDRLADLYAELYDWEDVQRAYQARRQLTEIVLSLPTEVEPERWIPLYTVALEALVDALEREPSEPSLLNYAGVLLYELMELGPAEALFRAARRLDPDHPHVRRNLKQVKLRKRGAAPQKLHPQLAARLRALGARGRRAADRARPAHGHTLSFCMIVKDEEEMLPGCLAAVAPWVDELVVVDTGSSDRTVEIAESFGAKVVHFPWNGSFADARNVSLEHVTGDWVLYLDADEHLMPGDGRKLRELLGRTWREAFYLSETNYTGGEESGSAVNHLSVRMWRNRPEYRFEGRIHEQKTRSMPRFLPERFEVTPIRIRHYGYLKSRILAKDKAKRNLELLELEAREGGSGFNSFNIGSEYLSLGEAATARRHLDESWRRIQADEPEDWREIPFVSALAPRMVMARRQSGDLEGGRRAAAEASAAYPRHTDIVFESALIERDARNWELARELAERCLAMGDAPAEYSPTVGTGSYLAYTLLGEIQWLQGDRAGAAEWYRRSLEEHPDYVAPVLPLVQALLAQGVPVEEAAAVAPDKASARALLATALYEAGHAAEAEREFRVVLERQPGNGAARIGLVEALLSQRRYEDAAVEALAEPEDSPLAAIAAVERLFALAVAGATGELGAALARAAELGAARHELELYGAWHEALVGSGRTAFLSADAGYAGLTALSALLQVDEFESFELVAGLLERSALPELERRHRLATLYLRRGYLDSAAEEWVAVLRSGPSARALVGLAQVALAGGAPADAEEFAEAALEVDPALPEAVALRDAARARSELVQAA